MDSMWTPTIWVVAHYPMLCTNAQLPASLVGPHLLASALTRRRNADGAIDYLGILPVKRISIDGGRVR